MKYAVTSQEMKLYDRNTSEHFGVPTEVLMERASLAVADAVTEWTLKRGVDRRYRILVLAGVGNNGGDGVCAGRLLRQRGFSVSVCLVGDVTKCSDLLLKQISVAEKYGIVKSTFPGACSVERAYEYDIIIDALFGIGLSRPLTGDCLLAVRYVNDCKQERKDDLLVLSIDMASGINADTGAVMGDAIRADMTVTFNQVKLGHILYPGCEYSGDLLVRDAGITSESFLGREPAAVYYDGEARDLLPPRRKDSNKGSNGKVLIIAGSKNISGACILAASAALRSGAGMVRVFTASENAEVVKALLPEALIDVYEDFEPVMNRLENAMNWCTQAVIGPGIGTDGKGKELLASVLEYCKKSLVMDADALNIIAEDREMMKLAENYSAGGKKLILTPHMGEFARLTGKSVRECKENVMALSKEFADRVHATVICKDARSIVADSNEKKVYINVSGNDGMATAGSGDVLAGITGALLHLDMSGFEIACAGAYIHGKAGDFAATRQGRYSMVATDIVESLPDVFE
jgi:NAD(P)H-hydrate epimerase